MKNIIFILFVFISTGVVAQNPTGKQYIPWLKSDAITIPGPADDATQAGYFIWHGDTIDFTMLTDSTIVYEQDSTVLFITLKQLVDSLNALPGGHSAVTIGANGTTAGLSITGQELNMQSATAARNGYLTAIDFSNFYSKLSLVVHTNLLSGNGTTVSPLSINTDSIAKRSWVLAQNYINENQLHYDSLAGLPTLPVIENIAFDAGWDGDLDGASKNVIYDAIAALPGGHDALTLSDSSLLGGLSLSGQLLDLQRATASQNGFLTYTDWLTFNAKAPSSGSANYIQNQNSSAQTANFWINGAGTLGSNLTLRNTTVSLNPNDVLNKIQWYKTDASSGGVGIPTWIQVRSEDYGGKFAMDFMTGTVADIDTPLVLSDTKVLVFNEKVATYPSGKKWAIFGDSFSDAITGEYGEWVNTKLGLTGTVSFGYPGNRIAHQLDTLDNILTANPDTLDFFNILSLLVGVNDFSANTALGTVDSNAGDANFAGGLKDFIETALTANPLLEIYIMTPTATNTVGLPYGFVNSAGWSLNDLSLLIGRICAEYSVNCIDLYALSGFNEQTIATYTTDNLHPNTAGVAAIGKVIANALTNKNSKGRYVKESDPIYLNDTSEIAYINQLNRFTRNQHVGDTNSVSNYISFGSTLDRSYVGMLRGGRIGFMSGNGIPSNTISQRINAATNYAYNSSAIKLGGGTYSFELVNKFNATAGDSLQPIFTVNQSGVLNAYGGYNLAGNSINTPGTLTNVVYKGQLTDTLNTRISNTAYNSTSWNGVTNKAPSLNAVRDLIEALPTGGTTISNQLHDGIVTGRNIDLIIADYTPSNKDILKVIADDDITDGDSITLSINGGTAYTIFDYPEHDKDYMLELMYYDGAWYVMTKMGEEAALKGNVDATNLIVDTNGIQYVGLGEDSFTDSTLVPMWWVLQQLAADNNSTQTLVGTTPYWNVVNGKNAAITLTGTTTITMSNLTDGDEGTLYVTNGSSSSYRITFAGYSVQIYPSVWYSGDEVAVSGSSKTDVFTYKYIGAGINKVIINGALDVK